MRAQSGPDLDGPAPLPLSALRSELPQPGCRRLVLGIELQDPLVLLDRTLGPAGVAERLPQVA